MGELDHTSEKVTVRRYRCIVPRHRIQVVENLSYAYLPVSATSFTGQIEQLREQQERLDQVIMKLKQIQITPRSAS